MSVPSPEQKFKFLKRVYFGVTNNPSDDVNPFDDLEEFGRAKVGVLSWGMNPEARERSKRRFADNFSATLLHFKVSLSILHIQEGLKDDHTNNEAVTAWVMHTTFN